MFRSGDKDRAGMMQMPPGAAGPQSWLCYFGVDDVDAAASKVGQLGGKLHVQPSDIPNVGRFSVCQDVTGSIFALFKSSSEG
jgi:predicted enzyme related to lactoylglutathione lyase